MTAEEWWQDPGFLAFDTETTGTDPSSDRIVTAAIALFRRGRAVETREWLFAVDVPIPQQSTAVHGITDEISHTKGQPTEEALKEIRDVLTARKLPIVAFHAIFDVQMLDANLARFGIDPLTDVPIICPHVIDKHFDKYVRGKNQRRLLPTTQRYSITLEPEQWHGATADAVAAGSLFLAEVAAFPDLKTFTADHLSAQVDQWRAEQEAEFLAWLARQKAKEWTDEQE